MRGAYSNMAFAFAIHESQRGDAIRLTLIGDLDLAAAPLLEQRLEELRAQHRAVRLDLSRLEFMDSSGVHVLIRSFNFASSDGWSFQIEAGASPPAVRLIELMNLGRLLQNDGQNGA